MSAPKGIVSVRIDDEHWDSLDETGQQAILAWGFNIAGDSIAGGQRGGPVFTGMDGGHESPHVGSWELY